ncbi:MAG: NUDIX hydrolase [Pseudomonadota bacterium]
MTGKPAFSRTIPAGDTIERAVCDHCGFVAYDNPKIVVGSVVRHDGRVLMCRRAIEPRRGFWTIPAGYLEFGETPEQGARREAREEANALLALKELLAIYTVTRIGQVQMFFRASLTDGQFSPGAESLETDLFAWDDIPWTELAFPTVRWVLTHDRAAETGQGRLPFGNPDGESADLTER